MGGGPGRHPPRRVVLTSGARVTTGPFGLLDPRAMGVRFVKSKSTPEYRAGRLKRQAARLLGSPLVGTLAGWVFRNKIPSYGLRIDTTSVRVTPRMKAQILMRIYESAEIRFIRRYLHRVPVVVELGASLGVAASHCLSVMSPDGRYIGVEANPQLVGDLSRVVNSRSQGRTVEIVHAAIHSGLSTVEFGIAETPLGGSVREGGVRVPSVSLSELLRDSAVDRYSLVMDIEGAELDLVMNDPGALDRCDSIVAEFHDVETSAGATVSCTALLHRFEALGFEIVESRGPVSFLRRPSEVAVLG